MTRFFLVVLFLLFLVNIPISLPAQRIVYSDPEKEDTRRLNYEIIGKVGGNFLIFKNNRARSWISVLDDEMQPLGREELGYMPSNDRTINVDFFPYADFAWMIYQYQRRNVIYCMAAQLDGNGRRTGELLELDTTHLNFTSDNKLYAVVSSEDRKRIALFKINSSDRDSYKMTKLLFNDKLSLLGRTEVLIPMSDRGDQLGDFALDNQGDLLFSRFLRGNNDNVTKASMLILPATSSSLQEVSLPVSEKGPFLDELKIKVDNLNQRYILTSLYSDERKSGIDGCFFYVWDKQSRQPLVNSLHEFTDELRQEAKGNATTRTAFNDFFIRQIIVKRDGGFIIGSEAYYTTSRANSWNRYDYIYGSPFMGFNNFYYSSPYYNRYWWGSSPAYGWGSPGGRTNSAMRYHADNIMVQSFDPGGQLQWSRVVSKTQFDDEADDLLSFTMMVLGGELHLLYNQQDRRDKLLNDFTLQPGGEMTRNTDLKNLEKGHQFLPKRGKQVSSRQLIIPTVYRSYICFAKVEYN
ncbi:MAG: hypothetical protein FJ340_05660 [Sphingomonadales bacterium]|nr:hypothetical protein [Sphingomonadales bacterium]